LANLLLARATARSKEMAVRLALGAARWRIVRQLLTESVALTALAAPAGVLLAIWLMNALAASLPAFQGIRFAIDLQLDWRVLLYTLAFSFLVGLLFGLAPALQASRPNVIENLKDGANVFAGARRQSRLRNGLIIAQVALSVVLLAGAGLVIRTLRNLNPINQGYNSLNLVVAPIRLEERLYDRARSQDFYRRLDERTRALPGVRAVVFADRLPVVRLLGRGRSPIGIEGYQPSPGEDMAHETNTIGPGYLTAMKIPIVQGRDFNERDREGAPCVSVVNESFVRRYFADGRALGKHLTKFGWKQADQSCEIVGVVRDNKFQSLQKEPYPWFAFPLQQSYEQGMTMLVHSTGDPASMVPAVRRAIRSLDQNIPVADVGTLNDTFKLVLYLYGLFGIVVGACGVLAVLLASLGIYGVVSYSVGQRTQEIGIRMALGAHGRDVLRMVVKEGMTLAGLGIVIGIAGALALSHLLTALLFGVKRNDPRTFALIGGKLALVALLACGFPHGSQRGSTRSLSCAMNEAQPARIPPRLLSYCPFCTPTGHLDPTGWLTWNT
jgi:predicted permease